MKKYLPYAAIVIVLGVLAAWLWPEETPAPVASAPTPVRVAPKPAAEEPEEQQANEEKKSMRVTFINHLGDAHIKFQVDGKYICTANAGKACNGDVAFGKHVVEALEDDKVVRTLELTLNQHTENPTVVVCFPTSPNC